MEGAPGGGGGVEVKRPTSASAPLLPPHPHYTPNPFHHRSLPPSLLLLSRIPFFVTASYCISGSL
jgi:hypothetical protein